MMNLKNQRVSVQCNKKRYNYFIEEEIDVGIVLEGSETKSMHQW